MTAAEPLRYAADVTLDDVDAITDFLIGRLTRRGLKAGTEEYRTNAALRHLVPGFAGSLTHSLGKAASEDGEQQSVKELRRLQDIYGDWNKLAESASPWKDVDGFDSARWRTVRFYDAQDEERLKRWEEKQKAAAGGTADFVSEYRIPGPRRAGRSAGEFVVARDPENADQWAVFEGSAQARHWDGTTWQHARFTGSSPYLFGRETALALAHQHAGRDGEEASASEKQ